MSLEALHFYQVLQESVIWVVLGTTVLEVPIYIMTLSLKVKPPTLLLPASSLPPTPLQTLPKEAELAGDSGTHRFCLHNSLFRKGEIVSS